ncbi:hypothetical protein [Pantoea ananatis]|uniref:hypothetical protein n=1 Tax=Pantoea ananas TaxID=553 RepID=UPI00197E4708|nr:hypothetical protein [Pantoea ananatis]MBN6032952.1 hypothetical protein [Pantoea ananatis]
MQTDIIHPDKKEDVHRVIGQAVSRLVASGKPLNKEGILSLLRESEQQSVDGTREVYAVAIRKVSKETG